MAMRTIRASAHQEIALELNALADAPHRRATSVPERAVNRGHQRPARRPENDPPHGARPGRSAPAAKRSPKQSAVLNLIVSAESAASRPSRTRSLREP